MAEQISMAPPDEDDIIGAISNYEELLLYDDNNNDDGNPLLHHAVNRMMEEMNGNDGGNHGTNNFSENFDETERFDDFTQPLVFGNPVRIPVWPVPPSPYSCSCCQTLREIFHVNGSRVVKLGIHGRLGLISHAVMESYDSSVPSENHEFYMFDFCTESISNVKQFLVQYCNDKKSEGYIMLQDPLSYFYDTLCTGLEAFSSRESNPFPHQTGQELGLNREEKECSGGRQPKSHIASQNRGKEQET